jgi:hypothetical protein
MGSLFTDDELEEFMRDLKRLSFKRINQKAWRADWNGWTIGRRSSTGQYVVRDDRRAWIGIFGTLEEAQDAVPDWKLKTAAPRLFRSIDDD